MSDPRPDDQISVRDGYLAMRNFVDRYWEEGNRTDDVLRSLLSDSSLRIWKQEGDEPRTADPAFWFDWTAAVRDALDGVQPEDVMNSSDRPPASQG